MQSKIIYFIFGLLFIGMLITSCSMNSKTEKGELIKVDKAFSDLSVKEGMHKAFLEYIADDGMLFRDGNFPIDGKEQLRKSFAQKTDSTFILSWEPLFEDISQSNDLAYTYGEYELFSKLDQSKSYGYYISIWKKQKNGEWKFILDVGTNGIPGKTK